MKFFNTALIGFFAAATSALKLRESSLMEEDNFTLAETDQEFNWSASHDCQFVTRRQRDQGYLDYADQVAQLAGSKWTDPTMPTSDAIQWSDFRTGSNGDLSTINNAAYLSWERLSDVYPASSGYSLFGNDNQCTIDDIGQGSVGNCWFMAAAAAIAEHPGRLEQIFGNKDQHADNTGFYDVNLYSLGVPITVRVDDFAPMKKNAFTGSVTPLFAKVTNNGVWMSVLEKAMAKLFGNYSGLVAGDSGRALMSLIGTPGKRTAFGFGVTDDTIFNEVSSKQSDDLISALSQSTSYYGIVPGHFYTVLDVFDMKWYTSSKKMIKLHNPWGYDGTFASWQFRDGDAYWNYVTAEEKERVGYVPNAQDGIIFMTIAQFRTAFSSYFINPMLTDWTRNYFLILDDTEYNPGKNSLGGPNYTRHEFTIKSDVDQDVILMSNVHDSRVYPKSSGCGGGFITVNGLRVVLEWSLPGSTATTYYQEGEYNFNGGAPYQMKAGATYTVNVELWNNNPNVSRDFSLVAFGQTGAVNIVHKDGLQSDHFFDSGL